MTLFTDDRLARPAGRRPRRIGWMLLLLALAGTVIFAMVPSPYVIEQPGPVYNTLGEIQTEDHGTIPVIEISGAETFPTEGTLDLLTVNLVGNRRSLPSWLDVAGALLDPSKAVLPLDSVYPPGRTVEQSNEQSSIDMENSQRDAVAAALTELGYLLPTTVTVGSVVEGAPADGLLEEGDVIRTVNGETADSVAGLRAIIAKAGAGVPVQFAITRGGVEQTVPVTPQLSEEAVPAPIVGIAPLISYRFPFEVTIQLENVGGPSAGQMLALGIIDKLTPGALNGGEKVAGTGTITAQGDVGSIGGIRQKLYGARDAGAAWFLAPAANCDEVVGHLPSGLRVVAVSTLDDSLAALEAIAAGSGTAELPTCSAG
ncbi:PDZ domain-containing protein [soil metagenome]